MHISKNGKVIFKNKSTRIFKKVAKSKRALLELMHPELAHYRQLSKNSIDGNKYNIQYNINNDMPNFLENRLKGVKHSDPIILKEFGTGSSLNNPSKAPNSRMTNTEMKKRTQTYLRTLKNKAKTALNDYKKRLEEGRKEAEKINAIRKEEKEKTKKEMEHKLALAREGLRLQQEAEKLRKSEMNAIEQKRIQNKADRAAEISKEQMNNLKHNIKKLFESNPRISPRATERTSTSLREIPKSNTRTSAPRSVPKPRTFTRTMQNASNRRNSASRSSASRPKPRIAPSASARASARATTSVSKPKINTTQRATTLSTKKSASVKKPPPKLKSRPRITGQSITGPISL